MKEYRMTLQFDDYKITFCTWQASEKDALALAKKKFPKAKITLITNKSNELCITQ